MDACWYYEHSLFYRQSLQKRPFTPVMWRNGWTYTSNESFSNKRIKLKYYIWKPWLVIHSINYIKTTSFSLKTWLNTFNQADQSSSLPGIFLHLLVIPLSYMQFLTVSLIIPSKCGVSLSNFLLAVAVAPSPF